MEYKKVGNEGKRQKLSTRASVSMVWGNVKTGRQPTYITQLIVKMKECLDELNAKGVTYPHLESMGVMIHESMSRSSRNYHSVQHVFDISHGLKDPIAILGAFFHDCIYYHVDGGLSPVQARILKGTYQLDDSGKHTFSTSAIDSEDTVLNMVECIFGFKHGQQIQMQGGLNEFLSAVIAVRQLQEHLPNEALAQIACCIESTIPFRRRNESTGRTPPEQLFVNLQTTRQRFHLKLQDDDLERAVQRAVLLSNNDVGNFGTSDRAWFLDNTWSLLPETNETLRQQYLYTVKEFQHGIFKLYGFFGFLEPTVVFQSFRGVPSQEEVDEKLQQCRVNLRIGKTYVGAKLLAVSVLAAFAELTGGDAPMSLFMGDLPSRHHVSTGLADSLPEPPQEDMEKCDADVYNFLSKGRRTETSFDIRQSPLAAFFYGFLGDVRLQSLLKDNKFHPMDEENSMKLLEHLPREAVEAVAENMITVTPSRGERIQALIKLLRGPPSNSNGNI